MSDVSEQNMSQSRHTALRSPEGVLIALFAVVLAFCIRIYSLGHDSYWLDEMVSLHFAKHPDWQAIFWDNNPPLHHLLLKGWSALFGVEEWATRLLSVFFSVATTVVMVTLGYRFRGRRGALAFGLLHASAILSVYYARETRMYAMLEFFASLNLVAFLRLLQGRRGFVFYGATALLMTTTQYLSILPLGIQATYLLHHKYARKNALGKRWLVGIGISVLAVVAAFGFYSNFFKWQSVSWQVMKFEIEPWSRWPVEVFEWLCNHSWFYAAGATLLVGYFLSRAGKGPERNLERSLLAVSLFAPIVIMFLFGMIAQRAVLLPRYYIYVVPAWISILGISIIDALGEVSRYTGRARRARLGTMLATLGALLVGTAANLPDVYWSRKEPWREVATMLGQFPKSVAFTTRTQAIVTPYFTQAGVEILAWNPTLEEDMAAFEKTLTAKGRVWIVENFWGATYFNSLKILLARKGYLVSDVSVAVDESAPVRVISVEVRK